MKYCLGVLLCCACMGRPMAQVRVTALGAERTALRDYTYYYPFYDGVQVIEIDYTHWALDYGRYLDAIRPVNTFHSVAHPPNACLLRNAAGEWLQQYNLAGAPFHKDSFLTVAASLRQLTTHHDRMQQQRRLRKDGRFSYFNYPPPAMPGFIVRPAGGQYGVLDTLGRLALPAVYDSIIYTGGYFYLKQNGLWGLADSLYRLRMAPRFQRLGYLAPNRHLAGNGACGVVDSDGKLLVDFLYNDIRGAGLFYMYKSGNAATGFQYGVMAQDFTIKTPPQYDYVEPHESGGFWAAKKSGWGMLGTDGGEQTPFKYYGPIYRVEKGYYAVSVPIPGAAAGQRYYRGFLDSALREVGDIKYDNVGFFLNGFGSVYRNGKWGFIDAAGNEAVPCRYSHVTRFNNGLAIVQREAAVRDDDERERPLYGMVNTAGRELLRVKYHSVEWLPDGRVQACMVFKKPLPGDRFELGQRCEIFVQKGQRLVKVK